MTVCNFELTKVSYTILKYFTQYNYSASFSSKVHSSRLLLMRVGAKEGLTYEVTGLCHQKRTLSTN
jgi:hypothetical protein